MRFFPSSEREEFGDVQFWINMREKGGIRCHVILTVREREVSCWYHLFEYKWEYLVPHSGGLLMSCLSGCKRKAYVRFRYLWDLWDMINIILVSHTLGKNKATETQIIEEPPCPSDFSKKGLFYCIY